jgi:hypothetical protein
MKLLLQLTLIFLSLFSSVVVGQSHIFETIDVTMSVKDNGKWSEFADPKPAKLSVIFDENKDRISIYSEVSQFFKIREYKQKQTLKDRNIFTFNCTNQEGTKCQLAIHSIKKEKGSNQLYIYYKNIVLIYNMKLVDD